MTHVLLDERPAADAMGCIHTRGAEDSASRSRSLVPLPRRMMHRISRASFCAGSRTPPNPRMRSAMLHASQRQQTRRPEVKWCIAAHHGSSRAGRAGMGPQRARIGGSAGGRANWFTAIAAQAAAKHDHMSIPSLSAHLVPALRLARCPLHSTF